MSYGEPIDLRAERFGVLLAAIGEEPSMRAGEGWEYGLAPGGWTYYMADIEPDEYAPELELAWECAEVAQAIRERQWSALERLGALAAAGEGDDPETRILALDSDRLREAARALLELGWLARPDSS
jgi:hypothetical protein